MPNKRNKSVPRRVVAASLLGNIIEIYDFTVYAFFAPMIAKAFFPMENSGSGLLIAVAVFGVGFFARPLGSVVIGAYADHKGRRPALLLTIALMALGTGMIALTPTYATIGLSAPIIIVIARLIQGFALGGEVGSATAFLYEIAPKSQKNLYASWQAASQGIAIIVAGGMGVGLTLLLSDAQMLSWGWRLPFIFGLFIIPVGFWLRQTLPETLVSEQEISRMKMYHIGASLREIFVIQRVAFLAVMSQIVFATIAAYMSSYMTTYAISVLSLPAASAMIAAILVGICTFVGGVAGGYMADRYGAIPISVIPRIILILMVIPSFYYLTAAPDLGILFVTAIIMAGLSACSVGAIFGSLAGAISAPRRGIALSVAYALIIAIFGGTAQLIVTWLINLTGSTMIPAYYIVIAALLSLLGLIWLRPVQD